jgi:hypothetical protein
VLTGAKRSLKELKECKRAKKLECKCAQRRLGELKGEGATGAE